MTLVEPVYISGPMTGISGFNVPAFTHASSAIRDQGLIVISPHELGVDQSKEWSEYLRRDIVALMKCNTIYMLKGWEKSRGATLEMYIATQVGMGVEFEQ